jgi:apolipoprotein N-acyltransferase
MRLALLVSLPVVSAVFTTLSLPSFDLGFLAWVALAPLLFALRQRGLLAGAALGWLFGLAFGASSFYWLAAIPHLNPGRFGLLAMMFSLYYLAFGFLYALASRSIGSWMILGGPTLWVALEYARGSFSFLAAPWNLLAHSQHQALPVIQIADLTGAYGVSFVLLMVNQLASQLPDRLAERKWPWRVQGAAVGLVVAVTLLYGWHNLATPRAADAHLRVAVVQANVTARDGMSVKEQMRHLATYDRLTREAAKESPGLIVWPSSSLPGPINFWMIRMYVNDVAYRAGVPLLVGGAGGDKFAPAREGHLRYSNSEFLISPLGTLEEQYNKVHLTPFTEQVPLHGIVRWPRWMTTLEKSYVPGDGYTLFQVSQARFGAPICWENAFPDVFRRFVRNGANFMVSVTNESVFGATSGPHQTLAMNVFRAVENRVAIARAATTGVSAFIDSQGSVVARVRDARGTDLFVPGIVTWDVPLSQKKTFYTLHGDVFALAVAAAAGLLALLCVAKWLRMRAAPAAARPSPPLPGR